MPTTAVERIGAAAELIGYARTCCRWCGWTVCCGLERSAEAESRGFYIAVLESDGLRFGLVVDDLSSPEEIVVKPLSAVLREIGVFSGATVLGNGTLAMILDVVGARGAGGVRPADGAAGAWAAADEARPIGIGADVEVESPMVVYEAGKRGPVKLQQGCADGNAVERGGAD